MSGISDVRQSEMITGTRWKALEWRKLEFLLYKTPLHAINNVQTSMHNSSMQFLSMPLSRPLQLLERPAMVS
jgi:hypothetical protein